MFARKQNNSSGFNMFMVTTITMLAKIFAIVRQVVLTYCYGAGSISDAYLLSQSIPNTLFLLASTAVGVSFTPVFTRVCKEESEKEADRFTSNIISILIVISTVLTVFTLIFAKEIVFLFANGFDPKTAALTAAFLRISIFSIYFIGMVGVFSAYLKIKGDYFSPAIIGIALSIVEISACLIAARVNDLILPIGVLVAALVQWIIVIAASRKSGYRHTWHLDFKSKYIKTAILTSLPVMVGLGVDEINVIIDRTIASTFQSGSISALTYANTIVGIIHTVVSVSVNSVVFVEVSKHALDGDRAVIGQEIFKGLHNILLVLVPATIGLIFYAKPIIGILYQRGSFDYSATLLTASVMIFYALYIIPNGIRIIVQSYFYAYGRTKFCMCAGIIAVAVNAFFNIVFSRSIGIQGLALATTLGVVVSAAILFMRFLYENPQFQAMKLLKQFFKILFCCIAMIIPSLIVFNILKKTISELVAALIGIIIACVIYSILIVAVGLLDRKTVVRIKEKLFRRHKE